MRHSSIVAAFSAALISVALARSVSAQEIPVITEDGIIKGTMDAEFKTRTQLDKSGDLKEDSPAIGAKDTYAFKITVAGTTEYQGKITRQPDLYTSLILTQKQKAQLNYAVDLAVRNPKNLDERKVVGKWVGTVPIDAETGEYDLAGGADQESPLRFAINAIGKQPAFVDKFGGQLVGKAENKEGLSGYTYKRLIGSKTVEVVVEKSDPMKFENLELAKGPSTNYPHTTVNGRLDYDYETGNWLTDGIRFSYNYNGKEVEDVVTGSIKWVEDENRKTNGKGYYDFNLRFNEEKNKAATTESDAFAELSDEDAFFVVDDTIPCITGKISYEDKFISNSELPSTSKIVFALNANKITKVQAVNFFKLWMVCVGPTNDE
jgi:hypothetical protein